MNRMDEYTALLAELEQTPEELDNTVNKALNRKTLYRKNGDFSAPRWAAWRPASRHSCCW